MGSSLGADVAVSTRPGCWQVKWHPSALEERNSIENSGERIAIDHAIEKLEVDGPSLAHPHQSAVRGQSGSGLRELRPRRGRSRLRPIYRRIDGRIFAILAVGPEAGIDKDGYERAVKTARQRLSRLAHAKGSLG